MKKIFLYTIIFTLFSCNDYLDIVPKGRVIPETIEDYDLLLTPLHKVSFQNDLAHSADDFYPELGVNALTNNLTIVSQLFTFENRYSRPSDVSYSWNSAYNSIYVLNKVINSIDDSKIVNGYKESDKNLIKARAKFKRAVNYFCLVNLYGKHYSQGSLDSPSIPLITKSDLTQDASELASVKEVYDFIIDDLNFALKYLPKVAEDKLMATKGGVMSLLARTYLYQADYTNALKYSKLAINELDTFVIYNNANLNALGYRARSQFAWTEQYCAILFSYPRGFRGKAYENCSQIFEANDMRGAFWIGPACGWKKDPVTGWEYKCDGIGPRGKVYANILPSVGEMYVTAAECLARNSDNQALDYLNTLRTARIPGSQLKTSSDFTSKTAFVKFILEERRRETLLTGTRLFDIKRQNLESAYQKTVVHKIEINGTIFEYKAEPNSGKLVLPIPENVKQFF